MFLEEVAFTTVAVGVVRGVGFGGGALVALTVVFMAVVGVVFFEDGFGFGDFVVDAGEDDAAGVFFGLDLVDAATEVGGGDLDAVEVHAGVAAVDHACGEGGEDAGDGDLDGRAVFEWRELEGDGVAAARQRPPLVRM